MGDVFSIFLRRTGLLVTLLVSIGLTVQGQEIRETAHIFPEPRHLSRTSSEFIVDDNVVVLIPHAVSDNDLFLAKQFVGSLSDAYGLALRIESADQLPRDRKFILLGSPGNQLTSEFIRQTGIDPVKEVQGAEGYYLQVSDSRIVVMGVDEPGTFYGYQSLRQLITKKQDQVFTKGTEIRDWPALPFRGVRLYVPGPENIPFFKRFVRDFLALYKFNRVILEMNAVMRLDRHPELNAGAREFAASMHYSRRNRPYGPGNQFQDSAHHDAGDGQILEKEEVKDLVAYLRRYHIDVIPEIPSLTHAYYLLNRHKELAEIQEAEWPDTYCPLHPGSYRLLFDVLDEYIEVMKPAFVHIGHDEWRMPVDVCVRCRGRDYRELYVQDVNRIHAYLSEKGVKTAIWGDHLLENVRGRGYQERTSDSGYRYRIPGGLTPEQVKRGIPKDILIFNWFWNDRQNDKELERYGFEQVYGNLTPEIEDFQERTALRGVLGGAPSSWAATTEYNLGKDQLLNFLGSADLLWSSGSIDRTVLRRQVRSMMPDLRYYLRGSRTPIDEGEKVSTISLPQSANFRYSAITDSIPVPHLIAGRISTGAKRFDLSADRINRRPPGILVMSNAGHPVPESGEIISIDRDVSSLIFLHACSHRGENAEAYRSIHNFDDTSTLLGFYEVEYEDGFVVTIPIRYGVNIAEWDWSRNPLASYTYLADPVEVETTDDKTITFFSFEWKNPRFGKPVRSIRMRSVDEFYDWNGNRAAPNALLLVALSVTERRDSQVDLHAMPENAE